MKERNRSSRPRRFPDTIRRWDRGGKFTRDWATVSRRRRRGSQFRLNHGASHPANKAVPMCTSVAPSSTAISKSLVMPIDKSVSGCDVPIDSRNRSRSSRVERRMSDDNAPDFLHKPPSSSDPTSGRVSTSPSPAVILALPAVRNLAYSLPGWRSPPKARPLRGPRARLFQRPSKRKLAAGMDTMNERQCPFDLVAL